MQITLPDSIARALGSDERAVLEEIAVVLYKSQRISLASATRMLGIDRIAFQGLLDDRDLDINYTKEEIEADIAFAEKSEER